MITFHPTTLDEMRKLGDYDSIFKSVCINEEEGSSVPSYLYNASLMKAVDFNGEPLGMLSVEPLRELGVEVHAYVLPNHRKRSKELLGAFKEALFTLTPITYIQTSVTGDFKPLVRFLSLLGFDLITVERGAISKKGQIHDLFVLQTIKENNYG